MIWGTTEVLAVISNALTDVGVILTIVIGSVVVTLVALLGLGFSLRKTAEHITGYGGWSPGLVNGPDKNKVDWDLMERFKNSDADHIQSGDIWYSKKNGYWSRDPDYHL